MMHVRRAFLLGFALLFASGCVYRDPSIDLLEGELRWMEDQVYMLEDELQQKCAELAACQTSTEGPMPSPANISQPAPAGKDDSGYEVVFGDEPSEMIGPQVELPAPPEDDSSDIELPPALSAEPTPADEADGQNLYEAIDEPQAPQDAASEYEIIEPAIELPSESESAPTQPSESSALPVPGLAPQLEGAPDGSDRPESGTDIQLQSYEEASDARGLPFDPHVTHIVVRAHINDGQDFDGHSAVPGILVVVEPRNASGEYVALAGTMALVVLDGQKPGDEARVARWDMDASRARRFLRRSEYGNGMHLELPWENDTPDSPELHLFVRYVTIEGRELEADVLLQDSESASRWRANKRRKNVAKSWGKRTRLMPAVTNEQFQLRPIPTTLQAVTQEPADHELIRPASVSIATRPIQADDGNRQAPEESSVDAKMPRLTESKRPKWKPYR